MPTRSPNLNFKPGDVVELSQEGRNHVIYSRYSGITMVVTEVSRESDDSRYLVCVKPVGRPMDSMYQSRLQHKR